MRDVAIGPSVLKVLLDVLLTLTAIRVGRQHRYDAIHSHEEAGLVGVWLSRRLGLPHLYDMHSSLPQQLTNFSYSRSSLLHRLFERGERRVIDGSRVVVTICQDLQDRVTEMGAGGRAVLIENVMGGEFDVRPPADWTALGARWGLAGAQSLVLYTGTFETYQGLDLLIEAVAIVARTHPDARLLVVGGEPAQVEAARTHARRIAAPVLFTGRRPPQEMPYFLEAADVLVSPRATGTNTPLKIYSYLRSGKPIVATDIRSHTQVLGPETALLVEPTPAALAAGITRLLDRPDERERLVTAALALAETKYSRDAYLARTRDAYNRLLDAAGATAS